MNHINLIQAILYFLFFLFLIYKNNFFGILKDDVISSKKITLLFFFKVLAIPVYVFIYKRFYGGLENFDAGNFYNDAKAVNTFAHEHFFEYLKMMFGLQDDNKGSFCYTHCLVNTSNWDNGKIRDFFYNDNRIVIRIHSIIHFIAFNSYYVHAFFSCFFSFIGLIYLYKSLKQFFIGKELWVLLILCFFPTLWFYTGSVSKEALTLLFLGLGSYQIQNFMLKEYKLSSILFLIFILFLSFLLKPYILLVSFLSFTLFYKLYYSPKIKNKLIIYFGVIFSLVILSNLVSLIIKQKSLYEVAMQRQRIFAGVAKGGIFLEDSVKFVRLANDTTLVKKVNNIQNYYKIKLMSPYMYWKSNHPEDTLFCKSNTDTITNYQLVYILSKSGSNIKLPNSFLQLTISSFYYTLFYPLFFNSTNSLQIIASVENSTIIISLIIIFCGLINSNKQKFLPFVLITLTFSVCYLIGITTPNSGAIIRYRSLVIIFILLAALYYVPILKKVK